MRFLLSLLLVALITMLFRGPAQAESSAGPSRAPWAPGPPDACSSVAVPCAQIDDINLTLRVSGVGFWGGAAAPGAPQPWQAGGGASFGATLSLIKTLEAGLSLPVMQVREPGPARWVYGPPTLRLRWRLGSRMGPPPFGGPWPEGEPYPKAIPAVYDVRPARSTFAVGLSFTPLWPKVQGEGPRLCRASESSCLAAASLTATGDLRLWRFLLTGHVEAVAAGDRSEWRAGGRMAVDLFSFGSAFSEAMFSQGIADQHQRGGLVLVGGALRSFRGAHLSAYYGHSFGGWSGEHVAGVQLDIPIGVVARFVRTLSEAADPFAAGDGWLYDDECAPMFRLGHHVGAEGVSVGDGHYFSGPPVPVGTHLWRKGDWLYEDQAATKPFIKVKPREGAPAPYPLNEAAYPWPDAEAARQSKEVRDRWLRRYAQAPDPRRQALCAELMRSFVEDLTRAALLPTLAERCAQARRDGAVTLATVGHVAQDDGAATALMGAQAAVAVSCDEKLSPAAIGALAGALRPGAGAGVLTTRRPPASATAVAGGTATHAPPAPAAPGAASAIAPPAATGAAGSAAAPPYAPPGWQPRPPAPGPVATHAPPAPGTPGLRPAAAPPAPPAPRLPPSRQLPPGPQPLAALPPARPPFSQTVTPWKRTVYQRPDIPWDEVRPQGVPMAGSTNREAAAEGFTPGRSNPATGKWDDVVLHHANQDPRGALVETWRSTHGRVPHKMDPPGPWRKDRPDWAKAFGREQSAYWKWRTGEYTCKSQECLWLPGDPR